jgi:hypothetical protein
MVSKGTKDSPQVANADKPKGMERQTRKKGSRVTQARAQAQRQEVQEETSSLKTSRRWGVQLGKPSCDLSSHSLH